MIEQIGDRNLDELIEELSKITANIKKLEDELSSVKRVRDLLQNVVLPQELENLGVDSVKVSGVGSVYLKHSAYVTYPKDLESTLFEQLYDLEMEDIIVQNVNPSTLKATIKERVKQGLPIPEVIKYTPYTQVQFRKA